MFAAGPFAISPFGDVSIPWTLIGEGTGDLSSTFSLNGVGAGVSEGIGALSSTSSLDGISGKIISGTGALSSTFTLDGLSEKVIGGSGTLGSGSTLVAYGAAYEFPQAPADQRVITVGTRQYKWDVAQGQWVPVSNEWAGGGTITPIDPNVGVFGASDNVVVVEDFLPYLVPGAFADALEFFEEVTVDYFMSEDVVVSETFVHDGPTLLFNFLPDPITEFTFSEAVGNITESNFPDVPVLNFDFKN